ncbi:MAG: hypothetical protein MRY64_07655 [Hyphomonadaceae bacterium]|nr:hypothetical protein [Hyphomonadaceae bacterium]
MQSVNDEILRRLDMLVRLQAQSLVSNLESQKEKTLFLAKAGFESKEIAQILGTTRNTVSVALSNARKAGELPPNE